MLKTLLSISIVCLCWQNAHLFADPPSINALFPAGCQRGQTVEVDLIGKPGKTPLTAISPDGHLTSLAVSEKGDKLTVETPKDCPVGLHWIRLYNDDGANSLLPFRVGTLPEFKETEPNNSLEETRKNGSIEQSTIVNGALHKGGEVDTFSVSLKAGQTLVASVNANTGLGSPMDAVLQILDDRGFVIAYNDDDHGTDPLIAFDVLEDGEYFVRIFAFPSTPNSTVNFAGGSEYIYRLTLTTDTFLSHAVRLEGGHSPELVHGWNLPAHGDLDIPELPGLHQLTPGSHALASPLTPSRQRKGGSFPVVLWGSATSSSQGTSTTVPLEKGQTIRLRCRAREFFSLMDPVVTITNTDGKPIKTFDDNNSKTDLDLDQTWKVPSDGNYTFAVTDRYGHGSERHFFVLELSEDDPRYELSVDADHFTMPADKPLEIPVTVNRLGGFDQEITIQAIDLLGGISSDPAVSNPKGDSEKSVKLRVESSHLMGRQGSFRIIGTSSEDHLTSLARVDAKNGTTVSTLLWISRTD